MINHYQSFLEGPAKKQWQRLSLKRRAGVVAPLFSIYSKQSVGIGEYPDLKLLADWCEKTGMSIIQLLPMNDVGFDFCPYDAQSSIALEPMYLSLQNIRGIDSNLFKEDILSLQKKFPTSLPKVNYAIKKAKLEILRKMFLEFSVGAKCDVFEDFNNENESWVTDYALFKVIKERQEYQSWLYWPERLKERDESELKKFSEEFKEDIEFWKWLQWQAYVQFSEAKKYAFKKGVYLLGDLPFLVSRDSVDVWSNQNYFKLDLSSGAPPDMYFAEGQRWGMPPYRWEKIEASDFDYVKDKLKYAENFYDLFRVDHAVGLFRIWTIANDPKNNFAAFDPPEESLWEEHGRKLLNVFLKNTRMLPCAEDLGTIPECTFRVLKEYGIPGIDVHRWMRKWESSGEFLSPEEYRPHSIAVISTHDTPAFLGWWKFEVGTVDEYVIKMKFNDRGIDFEKVSESIFDLENSHYGRLKWRAEIVDEKVLLEHLEKEQEEVADILDLYRSSMNERKSFLENLAIGEEEISDSMILKKALEKINDSKSIFSIQLLQEWLALDSSWDEDVWSFRINFPGTTGEQNWSVVMPLSLEEMQSKAINEQIKQMNQKAERIS